MLAASQECHRQAQYHDVFHCGKVGGEARQQVARTHAAEKVHRLPLQVAVHADAEIVKHLPTQPRIEKVTADRAGDGHQVPRYEDAENQDKGLPILRFDGLVHQEFQTQRKDGLVGDIDEQSHHQQCRGEAKLRELREQIVQGCAYCEGSRLIGARAPGGRYVFTHPARLAQCPCGRTMQCQFATAVQRSGSQADPKS